MKNQTNFTEVKEFIYHEGRQSYSENNKTFGDLSGGSFRLKERKEKVIHSGNATIVILDDGSKGIAKCNPDDSYNKTAGIKIAYTRAKIKSLQKELSLLTK